MAQVTPASIAYTPTNGAPEVVIDFHIVISEGHATESEITKYPVQDGFVVSNHTIRKNRKVALEGAISNMRIIGTPSSDFDYGVDSTREVKEVFDALVNSGTECKVVTNLGVYDPVVFNSFRTKQKAGMVDSMHFMISGEEVIKVDVERDSAAASELAFTEVPELRRSAVVAELTTAGYFVTSQDRLLESSYEVGEDYSMTGENAAGTAVKTTYTYQGVEASTGSPIYEVGFSEDTVIVAGLPPITDLDTNHCAEGSSLLGGTEQVSDCLVGGAVDVTLALAEDTIDTAMGKLKTSSRGVVYDTVSMGSEYGSAMLYAGIGCVVRGSTGEDSKFSYIPGESLPTTDQILAGLEEGLGIGNPKPERVNVIKILCESSGKVAPSTDFGAIPL